MLRDVPARLFLCILSFLGASPLLAVELAAVSPPAQRLQLGGPQLALLEDPEAAMTVAQVEAAWVEGRFEVSEQPLLNRGTTDAAYWIRLQLNNPTEHPSALLLSHDYAPVDDVRLYAADATGVFEEWVAGDSMTPLPLRPRTRLPVFDLTLAAGASQVLYLRVASTSNMNLELSVWPPALFDAQESRLSMTYGVLFGAIAATVLYLLYAARLAREPNALLLAAYLSAYGAYLSFLNGFPSLWLPQGLLAHVNTLHLVSLGLLFGLGAMFYRRFLQLATYGPKFDRVVAVLQWLGFMVVLTPVLPLPLVGLILLIVAGPGPLLTTAYAIYLWYKRREFAAVFAVGWAVAHLSSLLGTLRVSGVLPNTDLLLHLPAVGCAVACAFFTWAIARRVAAERMHAYTDYLTGLANRRRFALQGEIEFDRARRYGRSLSLLLVDVDHFKRVNDTWGHGFGDRVLQNVAEQCSSQSRDSDLVARIGGEEFAILLVETDLDAARQIAERLLKAQAEAAVDGHSVTVSIGVAEQSLSDDNFQSLLQRSDDALYSAKRTGRNKLCLAPAAEQLSAPA